MSIKQMERVIAEQDDENSKLRLELTSLRKSHSQMCSEHELE